MTPEEMWRQSGLTGTYEAWAFGDAPDKLASLVKQDVKTATCSSYDVCVATGEPIPQVGDYSVILDSNDDAICIVRTTSVRVVPFAQVTADHASKEGEGDRSLDYWRSVHEDFLSRELASIGRAFDENALVVCEEFELVYA